MIQTVQTQFPDRWSRILVQKLGTDFGTDHIIVVGGQAGVAPARIFCMQSSPGYFQNLPLFSPLPIPPTSKYLVGFKAINLTPNIATFSQSGDWQYWGNLEYNWKPGDTHPCEAMPEGPVSRPVYCSITEVGPYGAVSWPGYYRGKFWSRDLHVTA